MFPTDEKAEMATRVHRVVGFGVIGIPGAKKHWAFAWGSKCTPAQVKLWTMKLAGAWIAQAATEGEELGEASRSVSLADPSSPRF